jgi:hypothetical protein
MSGGGFELAVRTERAGRDGDLRHYRYRSLESDRWWATRTASARDA